MSREEKVARDFEKFMARFLEVVGRGCVACDYITRCLGVGSPDCHYSEFRALDQDINMMNLDSALHRTVWLDPPVVRWRWALRKLRDAIRMMIS